LTCDTLTLMKIEPLMCWHMENYFMKSPSNRTKHMGTTFVRELSTKGLPCGMYGTSSTLKLGLT